MTHTMGLLTGIAGLIAILSLSWRELMGRQWLVTAPVAFIAYQSINVFGVVTESRYDESRFQFLWPFLVLLAFAMFILGAIAASHIYKFQPSVEIPQWRRQDLVDDMRGQAT